MITVFITLAIAACCASYMLGAVMASGARSDLEAAKERLKYHLAKIILEADRGQITGATLENARRIIHEEK